MNPKHFTVRDLAVCAIIAALYTVLCLATAPISYGPVQVRLAEALTLLAIFSPVMIWSVTIGCLLSNLIGFMIGANPLFADIVIGTTATLIAAILTYSLRHVRIAKVPFAAALPPVLVNALIIGVEITWLEMGGFVPGVFLFNALYVGLGQVIACFALGLPLVRVFEKSGLAGRYLLPQRTVASRN